MAHGLKWEAMAVAGVLPAWWPAGVPIAMAIGNGLTVAGIGRVMSPGRGPVITTAPGSMIPTMAGYGFQASNGRLRGFIGGPVATTSAGLLVDRPDLLCSRRITFLLKAGIFTTTSNLAW